MNRYLVTIAAVALTGAAVLTSSPAGATTATGEVTGTGGAWGQAEEVPGTAALSQGGGAATFSMSCASSGNCSAGGRYHIRSGHVEAFVVSQVNGRWRKAEDVPGLATLNRGGSAQVNSVSCGSAGNCSAGGHYALNRGHHFQAFVVSQVNGRWGKAEAVPGIAVLNTFGYALVSSVSCASAGNCSAGGFYSGDSSGMQLFVVSQTGGRWGKAQEIPGIAALNTSRDAQVSSVSCASAGNCSVGGYYYDSANDRQAFVVSQTDGTWGQAEEVPGTAALDQGGFAQIISVSCASAGNCSAGGGYIDSSDKFQAFVVSQTDGTWGQAEEVPGTAALNTAGLAQVNSVSCASAGNCSAGGGYAGTYGGAQAFVVSEVNGTWGQAEEVPGIAALNTGLTAGLDSLSCSSAGNCSAGGYYYDSPTDGQLFVVSEVNGTWGQAQEVPGIATLNQGGAAQINSLSCGSAGHCSAGGQYTDGSKRGQAFVVSQT